MDALGDLRSHAVEFDFDVVAIRPWYINYSTDFDVIDDPGVGNSWQRAYEWAKLLLEPNPTVVLSERDTEAQRTRKEAHLEKFAERLKRTHGYVLHTCWGAGCEPTNFGLVRVGSGKKWRCWAYTKTLYAERFVTAHQSICALLLAAQKVGFKIEVYDEGGYWEEGDITTLIDRRQYALKKIASLNDLINRAIISLEDEDIEVEGSGTKAERILEHIPELNW